MQEDVLYKLALSSIPGIGGKTFKQLISYLGSAKEVFNSKPYKIKRIPGLGEKVAQLIKANSDFKRAEAILEKCLNYKIEILFHTDHSFPSRLKQIPDAPSVLYKKGEVDFNNRKSISIVGTRKPSKYGMEVTSKIVSELKKHKPVIVSGFAYGIDIQAHKTAIENNLPTVAVLAGGLNKIYPAAHKTYIPELEKNGALLSEHPPDTIPDAPKFPARNRIIAGLSDAVIIIEAAEKGGALITAELANGYNKDVFAIPGSIFNAYSKGCNNLIKNHKANVMTEIEDLEYYLNWDEEEKPKPIEKIDLSILEEDERNIIKALKNNTHLIIDELSWQTQISISKLAGILLKLEFAGLVYALPGKKFSLSEKYK